MDVLSLTATAIGYRQRPIRSPGRVGLREPGMPRSPEKMSSGRAANQQYRSASKRTHGWPRWLLPEFSTLSRNPASTRSHGSAAEYFRADTVLLGFADASRVWIKSYWGEAVRELPRKRSIFEMVLAEDGPVVVPDISKHPDFEGGRMTLRRLEVVSFASAPVRSS